MKRLIIYPKDVIIVTGKSERQSRYLLDKIRCFFQKEKHQAISIEEFCSYMGLHMDRVLQLIRL